ncbi:MAG: guanylate kinase [Oscillospiraceae bacterium]|nr:guanylate kinase [Oscillospiraceae bacterium]
MKQNKKGKILIISGCAGSGKGTVIRLLMEKHNNFQYSVSLTTRAPRDGEKEGVNYYFVTRERFTEAIKNGELVEYTEYCGNFYGTPKKMLYEKIGEGYTIILEIETDGAAQIMRLIDKNDLISVFLSPPTFTSLEERLKGRMTETEASITKRLETAKKEAHSAFLYDYIVINHDSRAKDAAETIFELCSDYHHESKLDYIEEDTLCPSFDEYINNFFKN